MNTNSQFIGRSSKREDGLSSSMQMGKAGEYLACACLLIQGFNAMLSDAGAPYDILIDLGEGKFGRMQVKSTFKMINSRQDKSGRWRHSTLYRFAMRAGRLSDRRINSKQCDYFAFVALDRKLVAFMKYEEVVNKNGFCKTGIEFKTRSVDNSRKCKSGPDPLLIGKFIEDYSFFKI